MIKLESHHQEAMEALLMITHYSNTLDQLEDAVGNLPKEFKQVLKATKQLVELFDVELEEQLGNYVIDD
jgi:hypothetical protein